MITSRDHAGKPIISITDGKDLGEIKGLYLDPDMRRVAGVFVGSEGLLNRKPLALSQNDVRVCGVDVWLVSGPDVVKPMEEIPESVSFIPVTDVRGREVQTEGGTKLCVIEDVILDKDAHVLGFLLGRVFSEGPLAERKTVSRDAFLTLGNKEAPMTVDLAQAESLTIQSI